MTLVPVDTTNALAVSDYLDKARQWLHTAVEMTGPAEIAMAKAEIATAAEATKQLGFSKEIQLDAKEMVRRAEYALGKAIRKGQAEGTIAPHGGVNGFNKPEVADHATSLPKPLDYGTRSEIYGSQSAHGSSPGALALADQIDDADAFNAALGEAKAEGNLSRANVARKAREKSGAPTPAPAGTTERAHQEAELINSFGSLVKRALTPKNVATLTPNARRRLIHILETALDTLKETSA